MIQVNVQGISGDKFTVDVGDDENEFKKVSVLELKRRIISKKGLDTKPEQLRLIFGGKQLDDEKLLVDYGVTHKSLIMSVIRVIGGK